MSQLEILLSTSGRADNIGDFGHTPSALRAFQRWAPDARVTVWPKRPFRPHESALIAAHFPDVAIVDGGLDDGGRPDTTELLRAFDTADLFVHGPGPSLLRHREMAAWARLTGKPHGVFGVTMDPLLPGERTTTADGTPLPDGGTLDDLAQHIARLPAGHLDDGIKTLLDAASFVYTRDSLSLAYLVGQKVRAATLDFGPDATFVFDLRDEARAQEFLAAHQLAPQSFVCFLPRLRYTPYHRLWGTPPTSDDRRRDAVNQATQDADMRLLRETLVDMVRRTGLTAVVCPEMTYEIPVAKRFIIDRLPDDVRDSVVWRPDFWLADEATAVYAAARAVLSVECHSPIMASRAGVPAIYLRQPTDTVKGQMWRDVDLADSVVEIDHAEPARLAGRLAELSGDGRAAATARLDRVARACDDRLHAMVDTALRAAS